MSSRLSIGTNSISGVVGCDAIVRGLASESRQRLFVDGSAIPVNGF